MQTQDMYIFYILLVATEERVFSSDNSSNKAILTEGTGDHCKSIFFTCSNSGFIAIRVCTSSVS